MTLASLKEQGKALFQKVKCDRRALLLLCIGCALLVFVSLVDFHGGKKAASESPQPVAAAAEESDEQRLQRLLSSIKGAGRVEVMLTYSEQTQTVYAAETERDDEQSETGRTRRKEKSNPVLLKGGDGQSGLVERMLAPKVQGVAVVCAGAADPLVRAQIIAAVSALFSLNSNHISVAALAAD